MSGSQNHDRVVIDANERRGFSVDEDSKAIYDINLETGELAMLSSNELSGSPNQLLSPQGVVYDSLGYMIVTNALSSAVDTKTG